MSSYFDSSRLVLSPRTQVRGSGAPSASPTVFVGKVVLTAILALTAVAAVLFSPMLMLAPAIVIDSLVVALVVGVLLAASTARIRARVRWTAE